MLNIPKEPPTVTCKWDEQWEGVLNVEVTTPPADFRILVAVKIDGETAVEWFAPLKS
jgi:hypothetical protein